MKNKHHLNLFIDLTREFDIVNHLILLRKLDNSGIRGKALDRFVSYLADKEYYVRIGSCDYYSKCIKISSPQGSLLGSILFLVHIN